jgi:YjbE family integral membrane protein
MDWLMQELAMGIGFLAEEAGHLVSIDWYRENGLALLNIIMIDLVLAGDNAIVVGMAASRVAPEIRAKVIFWGIAAAVVLRMAFAAITMQLLSIIGLTLAGGILLLWVCWKMYREITLPAPAAHAFAGAMPGGSAPAVQTMTFGAALTQIIIADVSMSLDNVLAVAGAAKGEIWVLAVGLTVAVGFMALLSAYIAKLLARYTGSPGSALRSCCMSQWRWSGPARTRSAADSSARQSATAAHCGP